MVGPVSVAMVQHTPAGVLLGVPDDAEDTGVVGFPSPRSSGCFLTVDGSKTSPSLSAGSSVRLGIT